MKKNFIIMKQYKNLEKTEYIRLLKKTPTYNMSQAIIDIEKQKEK